MVLNGEISDEKAIRNLISSNNYGTIIAVDGGANHLHNMGIKPDYIIGDLDSIETKVKEDFLNLGVNLRKAPKKKDETDSELAILLAESLGAISIDIFAALGGRIDHEIGNINLLYYILKKDIYPRIISDNEEIYILENDEIELYGNPGDVVSVIPIKGDANGITLTNLEYPLDEYDMEYSSPRGISNVMLGENCHIDIRDGCILVIKNKI